VTILSDNQSTLKSAAKGLGALPPEALKHLMDHTRSVTWKFNAPRGPWWGGFYERMMGIIKRQVSAVLFQHIYPTEAHLLTAVTISNRVMNSRPLTFVSSDDREAPEAISPAHFFKWVPRTELGQSVDFDLEFMRTNSLKANEMKNRRRHQVHLHQQIWKAFTQQYLLELRKYHASRALQPTPIEEGQLVLIEPADRMRQAAHKKLFWEKGRVKKLFPSRDKKYRLVQVERFNLDGTSTLLECPVQRLYPLEVLPDVDYERFSIPKKIPESTTIDSVVTLTAIFERLALPSPVTQVTCKLLRLI
jgi:hypothetical protein